MAKVSTNISLDADLKRSSQELFSDLGMDLSTAFRACRSPSRGKFPMQKPQLP